MLIALAKTGRRVLRLKGGDPYIFGRGGEEALALAREGIPFRFLPGITSAFGALGAAGIPPTMRGLNKAVILATGHTADQEDDLDWAALAKTGQPIIIYMGLKNLARITAALAAGGLAAGHAGGNHHGRDHAARARSCRHARHGRRRSRTAWLRFAGSDRHRQDRLDARRSAGLRSPVRRMTARGLIIGAPRSGAGKTSVTIGILRALSRRGLNVRGAKSGPDYIDPGFHAAATGLPGVNLDSWAMPPGLLNALAAECAAEADFVVIESAMGLFDGIPGEAGRSGSAADLARLYRLPVVLVLDVSGQSQTAAALAKGLATYDPGVRVAGVILNRLGSERHRRLAGDAIEALGIPVVGAILRDPSLTSARAPSRTGAGRRTCRSDGASRPVG